MKKFKFRFQKLLDVRTHRERKEQEKFSKVLSEYVAIENVIKESDEKRRQILEDSRTFIQEGKVQLFWYRDMARKGLKTKMNNFTKKLREKEVPLNKARAELLEAVKKKKMMEILKDKDFEKYKDEVQKEEQSELDEFGSNIYLRNKKIN